MTYKLKGSSASLPDDSNNIQYIIAFAVITTAAVLYYWYKR